MVSSSQTLRVSLFALVAAGLVISAAACSTPDLFPLGSGGEGGAGGALSSASSTMSSAGGGGPDGGALCSTLTLAPLPPSPIAWAGFPACDPQSDLCIVNPQPMQTLGGVAVSPTGTGFAVSDNTIASWKGAAGNVYRIPTYLGLEAVFAISDTDVWAVGEGSLLTHFDGAKWTTSELPKGSWLSGVWASGPSDVWVVGNFGAVGRYTGAWSVTTLPNEPSLNDVHGTGPDDVWAVGSDIDGIVEHWDGSQWSVVPAPADAWLEGVWAASLDDVWIVGRDGILLRGDAQGFAQVSVPVASSATQAYWDVWGSSSSDVWIVGSYDLLHFDGATWTRSEPLGHAITGRSATDALMIGGSAMRWDGNAWKEEFSVAQPSFNSAWAASQDDVWFAGDDGAVMRATNGALTRGTLGEDDLDVVWGLSATDVWIADHDGRVYRGDGVTFCEVDIPLNGFTERVTALGGAGPSDVWAMTSEGAALHFDGETWTKTADDINAISVVAFSPTDVWTSGDDLRRWDGTSWTYPPKQDFSSGGESSFGPLSASAPDDIWVAHNVFPGAGTHMAHWDGTVFTETKDDGDTDATLSSSAKDDVWSFGFEVRHYDGVAWSTVPTGRLPVNASVVTAKDVWAAGDSGLILRKTK